MYHAYMHTYPEGVAGFTTQTSVLFYTRSKRATRYAAARIVKVMQLIAGCTLQPGADEHIKGQLFKVDTVEQYKDDRGLYIYQGPGCGGGVRDAIDCDRFTKPDKRY